MISVNTQSLFGSYFGKYFSSCYSAPQISRSRLLESKELTTFWFFFGRSSVFRKNSFPMLLWRIRSDALRSPHWRRESRRRGQIASPRLQLSGMSLGHSKRGKKPRLGIRKIPVHVPPPLCAIGRSAVFHQIRLLRKSRNRLNRPERRNMGLLLTRYFYPHPRPLPFRWRQIPGPSTQPVHHSSFLIQQQAKTFFDLRQSLPE